tara:strand:+ start:475 stop:681 length:207 start_codon:yes stop_codon:yes gene_type:complete
MSQQVIAFNVRIMDTSNVERSDLEIFFNGTSLVYRDSDGVEYERQTLLGADFLVPEPIARRYMYFYGG